MQNLVYKTFELNTDIEHFAKPINLSGATTIRLTYLPSGVECWISSESNGTNLYPLVNRGDGWVDLPEPLYNLYIYTKGTNVDNEKIILNYTGQRDFFQYGNSSTERIDRVGELQSISNNVKFDLYRTFNDLFDSSKIKFLAFINGNFSTNYDGSNYSSKIYLTKLADLSQITFNPDKCYRIKLQGHCDFGSRNSSNQTVDPNSNGQTFAEDSIHLDIIDLNSINFNDNFTQITGQETNISNIFKSTQNFVLETKTNHFCFYGLKRFYSSGQYNTNHWHSNNFTPGNINFDLNYIAPAFTFMTMKDLVFSLKSYRSKDADWRMVGIGFHFSIKIQIEVMDTLPNYIPITINPYINNNI